MILRELFVKLGMDTNAQSFLKAGLAVEGVKKIVGGLVRVAKEAISVLPRLAMEAANHFDQIDEASQKSGVGVVALQELAYAAEFSSLALGDLGNGLKFLSISMHEASKGGKDQKKLFRELAVAYRNADGTLRDSDAVMMDVADKFYDMEDGAEKAAVAQKLFGKSGQAMIPFLNAGSRAIAAQRKEAVDIGVVYGESVVAQGVKAADAQTRLGKAWKGLKLLLAVELLPVMARVADRLTDWIKNNRELIRIKFREFLNGVAEALRWVAKAFAFVVEHSTALKWALGAIVIAFAAVKTAAAAATIAAMLNPWTAAFVALAAAILLVIKYWNEFKNLVTGEDGSGPIGRVRGMFDAKIGLGGDSQLPGQFDHLKKDPTTGKWVAKTPEERAADAAARSRAPALPPGATSSNTTNKSTVNHVADNRVFNINGGDPAEVRRIVREEAGAAHRGILATT